MQISLTEKGVGQLRPFEPGLDDRGAEHRRGGYGVGLTDISRKGCHEHAVAQIDPREIGADQPGVAHRHTAHIGIHQDRLGQIDAGQLGTEQVGTAQIGADHAAFLQTGATEIGL